MKLPGKPTAKMLARRAWETKYIKAHKTAHETNCKNAHKTDWGAACKTAHEANCRNVNSLGNQPYNNSPGKYLPNCPQNSL
jgi:hypothetical protein